MEAGVHAAMRLWEKEPPGDSKQPTKRLSQEIQGDPWIVPSVRWGSDWILKPFTAPQVTGLAHGHESASYKSTRCVSR